MLKRIKGQVWFCCPCCEQKLLKVVGWDASSHGLEGICKKCKSEYEISISREELEAVMTVEERAREDNRELLSSITSGMTIEQLEWMLAFGRSLSRHSRGKTDGKRQAN